MNKLLFEVQRFWNQDYSCTKMITISSRTLVWPPLSLWKYFRGHHYYKTFLGQLFFLLCNISKLISADTCSMTCDLLLVHFKSFLAICLRSSSLCAHKQRQWGKTNPRKTRVCERTSAVVFWIAHLDLDLWPEKHTQRKLHTETGTCRLTNKHMHLRWRILLNIFLSLSHTNHCHGDTVTYIPLYYHIAY